MTDFITLGDMRAAQARIAEAVYHTPLIRSYRDEGVFFKPESLQPIGSFKLRGAYNKIASLTPEERARGVVTHSSGNHAQGVAYAARALGAHATIVIPTNAPAIKVANTRALGAEVIMCDPVLESREEIAARIAAERGAIMVPPFDDPLIIAGQSTIGLEIAADLPDVALVITPVGGGGLLSGTAAALKCLIPGVRVYGVEPELAADAQASLASGHVVRINPADAARTIADGVRTPALGQRTFEHISHFADGIVTVSEDAIRSAWRELVVDHWLTVEPTGALPLAAWRSHPDLFGGARRAVLVLSGGVVEPASLAAMLLG